MGTELFQNLINQAKTLSNTVTSAVQTTVQSTAATAVQNASTAVQSAASNLSTISTTSSLLTTQEDESEDEEKAKTSAALTISSVYSSNDNNEEVEDKEYTNEEIKASYEDQIKQLENEYGIKTTSLGSGEADFSEYGAALSDELKDLITTTNSTEGAEKIQEKIADLYNQLGVSNITTNELTSYLKGMGYSVSSEYVSTTYIQDNKADGHYDTDVTNGAVNVLTVTDSEGNEFVIVDANGNGAIESEEIFMNEILQEVSINIDTSNFGTTSYSKASSSGGAADGTSVTFSETTSEEFNTEKIEEEADEDDEDDKKVKNGKEEKDKETEVTKKSKTSTGKTIVDDKEYKEIEQDTIDEYLEQEGSDYLDVLSDENATDEEKEEAQAAIDDITEKAQKYVAKHYSV